MSASSDLEHLLFNQPEERSRFHRALLDFAEYHVFTSTEAHGHAVLRNDAGVAHAMVFTSPEAAAAFPRPSGSDVRIMSGQALFTSLAKSGLPWWVFNVGGPAARCRHACGSHHVQHGIDSASRCSRRRCPKYRH